jgi:hypothetical protein
MTDPAYVLARRVLLDALDALREHRASVVLVGAQAIYLRVGEGDVPVAPYTTDGDLALDPRGLCDEPLLAAALNAASISRRPGSPGVWLGAQDVQIDVLVPEELAGRPGRRGADLGPHGRDVSRQVRGLSAAVVDRSTLPLAALDPSDDRTFDVQVARKAGLLVAKLHKIDDRSGTSRQGDKDALDVLRLLRGSDPGELADGLARLRADAIAGEATRRAIQLLPDLFGASEAPGSRMAGAAAGGLVPAGELEASCAALTRELLRDLGGADD